MQTMHRHYHRVFEVLCGSVVYLLLQHQYTAMLHRSIGIGIEYSYR